jgi:uncharacterized protein (DUF983 family)
MVKRIFKAGVQFDCPQCGKLWKDDAKHAKLMKKGCPVCSGDLRLVGVGDGSMLIGDAIWFRCLGCKALYMKRRGELVPTQPRAGFRQYTEF